MLKGRIGAMFMILGTFKYEETCKHSKMILQVYHKEEEQKMNR